MEHYGRQRQELSRRCQLVGDVSVLPPARSYLLRARKAKRHEHSNDARPALENNGLHAIVTHLSMTVGLPTQGIMAHASIGEQHSAVSGSPCLRKYSISVLPWDIICCVFSIVRTYRASPVCASMFCKVSSGYHSVNAEVLTQVRTPRKKSVHPPPYHGSRCFTLHIHLQQILRVLRGGQRLLPRLYLTDGDPQGSSSVAHLISSRSKGLGEIHCSSIK